MYRKLRRSVDVRRDTRRPRLAHLALVAVSIWTVLSPSVGAQNAPYAFYQINAGFSPAMDVNDNGTVVGWWFGPNGSRGYVWTKAGGAQPIITDPNTINRFPIYTAVNDTSQPVRINPDGVIAGQGSVNSSLRQAAIWSPNQGLQFLGSFDGNVQGSLAAGINGTSQVAGTSAGGGYNNYGPFVWTTGTGVQPLTGFTGINGSAYGINEHGEVVGTKGVASRSVPFFWSPISGEVDIPDVQGGATLSLGLAINDLGVVVGRYVAADGMTDRVFRWSAGTGTQDLNAPAGFPETMDINNSGEIVVTLSTANGRVPYLYQNGTWTNLNDLLPSGTGFRLQFAEAINNKGWIAGVGTTDPNGAELGQGFLIIPPNHPPVASNGTASVVAGASVQGTLIASDADGDPLTYSIVTNGAKGSAVITNAATGAFTYTANAASSGTDTFTFKANDGFSDSNTATITITITAASTCAVDISANVVITGQAAKLNRKSGRYTQSLTIRNGDGPATGPISLVVDGLSSNATLTNATGSTVCATPSGSPYVNVDVGADGVFSSRERATVTLEFSNPSGQPVTYTTRVLAGAASR